METQRPEYLTKIDQALANRELIADFVAAGLEEANGKVSKELTESIQRFRGIDKAETLLLNERFSGFLPLVMSYERGDRELQKKQLQFLAMDDLRALKGNRFGISYFAVMACMAIGVHIFQAFVVSPPYEEMFGDFHLRQPMVTRFVLDLNQWTRGYGLWFFIGLMLVILFGAPIFRGLSALICHLQKFSWIGWFLAGGVRNLDGMNRFLTTMAELADLQTPVEEATPYAAIASRHPFYRTYAAQLLTAAKIAQSPPSSSSRMPPTLLVALRTSSPGAQRAGVLRDLAEGVGDRLQIRGVNNDRVMGLWGVLIIGCMVGFLALTLFLPFTSILIALS